MADEFGQRIQGLHAEGDATVATDKHVGLMAKDASGDYTLLNVTATGALQATGGSEYADGDTATGAAGGVAMGTDGTDLFIIKTNASGELQVGVVGTVAVTATALDIRALSAADVVTAEQGTSPWVVSGTVAATQSGVWDIGTVTTLTGITNDVNIADGGNSITVDAVDLDVRDLTHTTDSVKIGDGTDFLAIETDGSINVNASIGAADSVYDYAGVNLVKDTETTVVSEAPAADTGYTGVMVSGAGYCEWAVKFGTTSSEAIIMKFWTTPSNPTYYVDLPDYLEVSSGETILITGTNREKSSSPNSDFVGHATLVNKA